MRNERPIHRVKTDNELITEFMEIPQLKDLNGNILWDFQGSNFPHLSLKEHELNYSTSWNWLMPVVDKIESLEGRTAILFSNTHKHICTISDRNHTMLAQKDGQSKIEAVYKAVLDFIKWYNETKQS